MYDTVQYSVIKNIFYIILYVVIQNIIMQLISFGWSWGNQGNKRIPQKIREQRAMVDRISDGDVEIQRAPSIPTQGIPW